MFLFIYRYKIPTSIYTHLIFTVYIYARGWPCHPWPPPQRKASLRPCSTPHITLYRCSGRRAYGEVRGNSSRVQYLLLILSDSMVRCGAVRLWAGTGSSRGAVPLLPLPHTPLPPPPAPSPTRHHRHIKYFSCKICFYPSGNSRSRFSISFSSHAPSFYKIRKVKIRVI